MAFFIRNVSNAQVSLDDLGITLAIGEDYDLVRDYATDVAMSDDLRTAISNGDVVVLNPLDDTTPLSLLESLNVLNATNNPPYGIRGGKLNQISDVDTTGALNNYVLTYDSNDNKWKALPQSGGGGVNNCFPFWKSDGSSSNIGLVSGQLPFYLSDGTARYINVVPC